MRSNSDQLPAEATLSQPPQHSLLSPQLSPQFSEQSLFSTFEASTTLAPASQQDLPSEQADFSMLLASTTFASALEEQQESPFEHSLASTFEAGMVATPLSQQDFSEPSAATPLQVETPEALV